MTRDSATEAAGRRSSPAVSAALLAVLHAAVAAAAVAGCLTLIHSPFDDANLPTRLVQASGIVALIWAYAGLVLGLLIGIRPLRARSGHRQPGRSVVLALHRQLNLVVLALVLLHALIFALGMPGGSLLVAFIPGISGPQSVGYTVGVLALYLALVLGPSYYLRDRIGRRTWLVAHQLAALSYTVALWHALALGTEIRVDGIARTLTWALQIPLLALITARLFRPRRPADQLSATLRRGRYSGRNHARLRAAIALGLFSSAVLILLMALLAGSAGLRVNG
jgi:predicted ferric reductase